MKAEDVRRRLQEMSAEDLRVVAAQLYWRLPQKVANEREADRLIEDPRTFLKLPKVAKLPACSSKCGAASWRNFSCLK